MKTLVYAADESTVVGHIVDGKFVATQTIPPAPEGDALEDLLDDACHAIEQHPRVGLGQRGRMDSSLRPCNGQRSLMLTDGIDPWQTDATGRPSLQHPSRYGGGVRAWIVKGTLRSVSEVNKVLNDYANARETACRRRQLEPDWKFTVTDIWELGKKFGLAGPPTQEEIAAMKEKHRQEQEARRQDNSRREKEIQKRLVAERLQFEASPEGQRVKKVNDVVEELVGPLVTFKTVTGTDESNDLAARQVRADEFRRLTPWVTELVNRTRFGVRSLVRKWRDAEEECLEVWQQLEDLGMEGQVTASEEEFCYRQIEGQVAYLKPGDIPELQPGTERVTFATLAELLNEFEQNEAVWWERSWTLRMSPTRELVIDFNAVDKLPTPAESAGDREC